jgi:MtN3 and saliva related transmembrane protein
MGSLGPGMTSGTCARTGHCALMLNIETFIGLVAALCTTASYIPQVKKSWQTGSTGDLSLRMLAILAAGIALWVVYGFLKSDIVIIVANTVSLVLLMNLLVFKLRENGRAGVHA